MAGKVSLKPIYLISLIFGIGLILYSCMSPVDIQGFLEDPKVKEVIENNLNPGLVKIDTADSDSGLKAGNSKITGIKAGHYYKIEEIEDNKVVGINFVKADGSISDNLKDIRKINSVTTAITGLTNDVTYRVKSATAYTNADGKITYFALTNTPDTPKTTDITNGAITIYDSRECYFNVADKIAATGYYEVIKFKTAGTGNEKSWEKARTSAYKTDGSNTITSSLNPNDYTSFQRFNTTLEIGIYQFDSNKFTVFSPVFLQNPDMSIMDLPAPDTVNDYVFIEYYAPEPTNPSEVVTRKDFYYLTVSVNPAPPADGNITINPPTAPSEEMPILTYLKNGISQNIGRGDSIEISLSDSALNRTITANLASYWYYDNIIDINNSSLTGSLVIGDAPFDTSASGKTYRIIVERPYGGLMYSTWFTLNIIP